jgi:hypothetical protein
MDEGLGSAARRSAREDLVVVFLGRFLLYLFIVVLALFVLASYTLIQNGGGHPIAAVQQVSVHDLTTQAPLYEGHTIVTTGRLSFSDEHGRYQLVDDANFAVVIKDFPDEQLELLKDMNVKVSGMFGYERDLGVFIEADVVTPVTE